MKKRTNVWLLMVIGLAALVLTGSNCGGKKTNKNTSSSSGPAKPVPTANLGTISGVISFEGTPPAARKIDTSADPVCGQKDPNLSTEDTVVKDGKLANVFIFIKDGAATDGTKINDYDWKPSTTKAPLDQNGCHYRPHVLGVQVNQIISITNSDATQHNIHPTPTLNTEWNKTQANGAPPIETTFDRAEQLITVKCNQHPWMKAYVGVTKHPFFAVSAEDGTFTIKGVPAGKYNLVAWKEGGQKGTEKVLPITVEANGTVKADFSFSAATASASTSLQMAPAVEFPMLGRH